MEGDGRLIVLVGFNMLGASIVVPWLAYITAIDYFREVYPTHSEIEYVLALISMTLLVAGKSFMLWIGNRWDLHLRLVMSLVFLAVFLSSVPLINVAIHSAWIMKYFHSWSYTATLLSHFLCSCTTSVLHASVYGLAGQLGGDSIQAVETGKGYAGVVIIALRLVTKAMFPGRNDVSMMYFFAVSISIVVVSLGVYLWLRAQPFAVERLQLLPDRKQGVRPTETTVLLDKNKPVSDPYQVFYMIAPSVVSVVVVYMVCCSLFPGVTTSLTSTTYKLGDWFPLVLIATYNVTDLIGKNLPQLGICFSTSSLYRPLVAQLALVPLFIMAVEYGGSGGVVGSDPFVMVIVGLLGIFTGYFGCGVMVIGVAAAPSHDKEVAGQIMSLGAVLGLFLGSVVGYIISFFAA